MILHLSSVESVGCELQDAAAKGRAKAVALAVGTPAWMQTLPLKLMAKTALMLASGNGHEEVVRFAAGSWCGQGLDVPEDARSHGSHVGFCRRPMPE